MNEPDAFGFMALAFLILLLASWILYAFGVV